MPGDAGKGDNIAKRTNVTNFNAGYALLDWGNYPKEEENNDQANRSGIYSRELRTNPEGISK